MNITDNKLRICMCIPFLHHKHGMENQAWRLSQKLIESDEQVSVFFITTARIWEFFQKKGPRLFEKKDRISIYTIPGIFAFNKIYPLEMIIWYKIYLFIFRKRYDVIHAYQLFSAGLAVSIANIFLKKKILIKVAGSGVRGDAQDIINHPFSAYKLRLLKKANKIIAINPEIAHELTKLGFYKNNIVEILNGIDVTVYSPDKSDKANLKNKLLLGDGPNIISVARLSEDKNMIITIRAFKILKKNHPDARLYIAGRGGYGKKNTIYQDMVRELGLTDSILFLGEIQHVRDYLRACDIFILTSLSEGISNSLLEACSCAVPVVVSNNAGNREVVIHRKTGLLVPPQDAEGFSKALDFLLKNPHQAKEMGVAARKYMIKRFSFQHVTKNYISLYKELNEE